MERTGFINDILVVIVLYKQTLQQSIAYTSLQKALGSPEPLIFLYDNSPNACTIDKTNIIYRHDPHNGGVSKAYNEGFRIAGAYGKQWMLLLDQDTQLNFAFFMALGEAVRKNSSHVAFVPKLRDRYGLTSPFRWLLGGGVRTTTHAHQLPLNKFRFLNSGLLIRCTTFEKASGYEEAIPVYFSDIAFGEKLMREGTRYFVVVDVILEHSLSSTEETTWQDALQRYQYFCEGAITMSKKFGYRPVYYLRAMFRGLILTWRYKRIVFIKSFFIRPT